MAKKMSKAEQKAAASGTRPDPITSEVTGQGKAPAAQEAQTTKSGGASSQKSQGKAAKGAAAEEKRALTEVRQARSGGKRERAEGEPILDNEGNEQTHSPDLTDNAGTPAADVRKVGGFPTPIRLTAVDDVDEITEKIRKEDKADVLYLWRDQERAEENPRADVIDLINRRLLSVQGPPLRP
jgi:hypothetical protein